MNLIKNSIFQVQSWTHSTRQPRLSSNLLRQPLTEGTSRLPLALPELKSCSDTPSKVTLERFCPTCRKLRNCWNYLTFSDILDLPEKGSMQWKWLNPTTNRGPKMAIPTLELPKKSHASSGRSLLQAAPLWVLSPSQEESSQQRWTHGTTCSNNSNPSPAGVQRP